MILIVPRRSPDPLKEDREEHRMTTEHDDEVPERLLPKPGGRVGAVLSTRNGVVRFLGWGTYEGNFLPPGEPPLPTFEEAMADPEVIKTPGASEEQLRADYAEGYAMLSRILGNPRIRLDSGDVVWGRECWWGAADEIASAYAGRTIIPCVIERNDDGTYRAVVDRDHGMRIDEPEPAAPQP